MKCRGVVHKNNSRASMIYSACVYYTSCLRYLTPSSVLVQASAVFLAMSSTAAIAACSRNFTREKVGGKCGVSKKN